MKYKITSECIGCQTCISECKKEAIVPDNERCQIFSDKCDGCKSCVSICPVEAIVEL